jgi:hypothetical protein
VSVAKLNILGVELDERLDEAGFRHAATSVGDRLGAQRIGANETTRRGGRWRGLGGGERQCGALRPGDT